MLINMAWPRAATNPRPEELQGTLNPLWHWLNSQPVLWTVLVAILIVGGLYYGLVQRTKPAHLSRRGKTKCLRCPRVPTS